MNKKKVELPFTQGRIQVVVHEQMKDSSLNEFNGNKINLPEKKEFHPNLEYVKYHRKNIFGRLKPLRNN